MSNKSMVMPQRLRQTLTIPVLALLSGFFLLLPGHPAAADFSLPTARALESDDRSIQERFEQGIKAYTEAEFMTAEMIFRDLGTDEKTSESDREIFLFMMGRCLYAQSEFAFTVRHLDRFRNRFPESEYTCAAHVLTGHCLFRAGHHLESARAYVRALTAGPEHHRAIALDNLKPLVIRGLESRALDRLVTVLRDEPWSAQVRFWIAERWASADRRADALAQYRVVALTTEDGELRAAAEQRALDLKQSGDASVIIGLLAPLTGDYASFGWEAETAARLVAERSRAAIRLVVQDTRGDPVHAAWAADSLLAAGCDAVIGPLLADCIAATVGILRAREMPQILPVARRGGNELTGLSPYLFSLSVPPDRQAGLLLHAAIRREGMQSFAAFFADTPEGHAAGAAFARQALEADATMYPIQYFRPATLDYAPALRRLKRIIRDDRGDPLLSVDQDTDKEIDVGRRWRVVVDGFVVWGDPEDILQIVSQARGFGFESRFLGNAAWGNAGLLEPIRSVIDSVLFVSDEVLDRSPPEWKSFSSSYRERSGQAPGWLAARVYDAVGWLARYAAEAPDPARPFAHLTGVEEFEGVAGPYRFSADRQRVAAALYHYRHGRAVRAVDLSQAADDSER